MAYNNKNLYRRMIAVQGIYLEKKQDGVTNKRIFEAYIKPLYHISEKTFYTWLGTNAKRLLKKEEKLQQRNTQTSLF